MIDNIYTMEDLKEQITTAVNIYKSGNLIKAEKIAKRLIQTNPKVAFLHNFLGIVVAAQNKIEEAINHYENGIKVDPNFAMLYNNLALIYFNLKSQTKGRKDYLEKAEKLYKKAIEIDKINPEPFTNLGNLYNFISNTDEAIKNHKIAIKTNPKFFFAYLNLANVLVGIGNYDEAKIYLNESIKINPNFTQAHRLISRITKYTKDDLHLTQLKTLYDKLDDKNIDNKINLAYALGKANEDIKSFDKSFLFYNEANNLNKKKLNFSINKEKNRFDEIKSTFNKQLLNKLSVVGSKKFDPIFIIGMPRSGTTLIEQILATHTDVFGADEIEFIPELIKKYFRNTDINLFLQGVFDFDKEDFKKMGEEYASTMRDISKNSIRTTDKLPANFLSIGLIKLILPNSKIIHCTRNPQDNIFSIFKNHFPSGKINYSNSLVDIVEYYNLYFDLMKYWNSILPNFIFNIKYENLVYNTESEVKKLLSFCNLEWQSKCLKFYNTKRVVKTASDTQVRSKIFNTSINYWKNYEKYLKKYYDLLKV